MPFMGLPLFLLTTQYIFHCFFIVLSGADNRFLSFIRNREQRMSRDQYYYNAEALPPPGYDRYSRGEGYSDYGPLARVEMRPPRRRKLTGRILGGDKLALYRETHPYQLYIQRLVEGELEFLCGAVLIHIRGKQGALTAAHCLFVGGAQIPKESLNIVGGDNNIFAVEHTESTDHPVEEVIIHPDYNSRILGNDIAILFFKNKFIYGNGKFIGPISLPESEWNDIPSELRVSGWGSGTAQDDNPDYPGVVADGKLKYAFVRPISVEDCLGYNFGQNRLSPKQFCALGIKEPGAVFGRPTRLDAGGPAVGKNETLTTGSNRLYGIFSYTLNPDLSTDELNLPSVFVKMSVYKSWIEDIFKAKA